MKRIFLIMVLFSVIYSCDDSLDEFSPYDRQTTDIFYQTNEEFELAIRGVYGAFLNVGYYGGSGASEDWNIVPDLLADNLTFNPQGRQSNRSGFEWQYNSNDTPTGIYTSGYFIVSRANNIINQIDNIPSGAFRDNILAEALAIRGMVHFDLARYYSQIPTQSASAGSSIGIAYPETFDPFALPSRLSTVNEVYSKVINDLTTAANLINASNPVGRLNKAAVYGVLARVYLHAGDYPNAIAAAQESITNGATVATLSNFPNVWTDNSDEGVLFEVKVTNQDDVSIGVNYSQTGATGTRSEYVCDYSLYQLYNNNDVRKSAYFDVSNFEGNSYINIKKYSQGIFAANVTDGKYIRGAEVYLTLAEAILRNGGSEVDALNALDMVRQNRYIGFSSPNETGTALLNAVMLERRLELAFESDRFFTLKRLGLPVQRSNFGEFSDGSGSPAAVTNLPAGDFRWQLPIPQGALNENPNIQQNSNY